MVDSEQAARNFYNGGGGSYPPVAEGTPGAAPLPDPKLAEAAAAPVPAAAPAPAGEVLTAEDKLELMYGSPTRRHVDWNEPVAQPADYRLEADRGVLDESPEGKAAMLRLRDGLTEAGAGQTLAAELFADAVRAQRGEWSPASRNSGETELRRQWGDRYDAKVASARDLIQRAAVRAPEIIGFLERTGLGNDPAFITKLAQAALRQKGRRR